MCQCTVSLHLAVMLSMCVCRCTVSLHLAVMLSRCVCQCTVCVHLAVMLSRCVCQCTVSVHLVVMLSRCVCQCTVSLHLAVMLSMCVSVYCQSAPCCHVEQVCVSVGVWFPNAYSNNQQSNILIPIKCWSFIGVNVETEYSNKIVYIFNIYINITLKGKTFLSDLFETANKCIRYVYSSK